MLNRSLIGAAAPQLSAVASQVAASATAVLANVLMARTASPREFGAIALVLAGVLVLNSVVRAAVSNVALFTRDGSTGDLLSVTSGASLLLTIPPTALIWGLFEFATPLTGHHQDILFLLPLMALQDSVRYTSLAIADFKAAILTDGLSLTVFIFWVGTGLLLGRTTTSSALVGWGVAIAVGSLAILCLSRSVPSILDGHRWLRKNASLARNWAVEALTVAAVMQAGLLVIGLTTELEAAGGYKLAAVAFGVAGTVSRGLVPSILARASSLHDSSKAGLRKLYAYSFGGVVGLYAICLAAFGFNPFDVMGVIFGPLWGQARRFLLPLAINAAAGFGLTLVLNELRFYTTPAAARNRRMIVSGAEISLVACASLGRSALLIAWASSLASTVALAVLYSRLHRGYWSVRSPA